MMGAGVVSYPTCVHRHEHAGLVLTASLRGEKDQQQGKNAPDNGICDAPGVGHAGVHLVRFGLTAPLAAQGVAACSHPNPIASPWVPTPSNLHVPALGAESDLSV
eukprot:7968091-Karenia_brevis.AAC.1